MRNPLVLANIDYRNHTTNEGDELQSGLAAAGWILAGHGFANNYTHVPTILDTIRPDIVFVQDKRDWDKTNAGCFNHAVSFERIEELAKRKEIFKVCVVKDAGGMVDYHSRFCKEIAANVVVTYYHQRSVEKLSPFLKEYRQIRTYHTVDAALLASVDLTARRQRAIVTGAVSQVYPLRQLVIKNAAELQCAIMEHPGYSNRKCYTPGYLHTLAGYKVHIATASTYGFALRKIIESVAVGAIPITDLPAYDMLPEIDGALVRVSPKAKVGEIKDAIDEAVATWDLNERLYYARKAQKWYDFRRMGLRLSALIADEEKVYRGKE